MRIDAHIHFWRTECGFDNKPIADNAAYRRDFMPADVEHELADCGIDAVVLVQTCPQVEETSWLLDLAETSARILGVTAWVDLDAASCDFTPLLTHRKLVGIRAQLRRIADATFVTRPTVLKNITRALDAGLGVTMLAEQRHYECVLQALDSLPSGPITLNHLGMRFPDVDRDASRVALRRFSAHSNVFLQLSGLPFLFGTQWREPDALGVLDDALDIFGPDRLLFASDWPMMLRFATYTEWVQTVESFVTRRGLTDAERAAIFGRNALRANPRVSMGVSGMSSLSGAEFLTD
jgi:L-fuconolactonase